jgi:hypothetical protein
MSAQKSDELNRRRCALVTEERHTLTSPQPLDAAEQHLLVEPQGQRAKCGLPGEASLPMSEANIKNEAFCRDIIVVGASAGGLEPLQRLLGDLPDDLQASIFVVLHIGATSRLVEILDRTAALPVMPADSGQKIEPGRIYIAVPDRHLLVHDRHILLRRGPRENLARPAIDPLFRSAACTFGGRVVGVVLSGSLNDGTAGLRAIKRCGGLAVVQQPDDAAFPDELGRPSRFTCPECHGALWEVDDGSLLRYRCHVGHALTADAVLHAQAVQAEEMLWSLMRTHQERAALARRMAERERTNNHEALAEHLLQRADGYDEDAEVVRGLLRGHTSLVETEDSDQDAP